MQLTVTTGRPFVVELASAPSTGYMWQVPPLPSGVRLLRSEFHQRAEAAVGDPGVEVFQLVVDDAGEYSLIFVLKRQWESESVQTEIVQVTAV